MKNAKINFSTKQILAEAPLVISFTTHPDRSGYGSVDGRLVIKIQFKELLHAMVMVAFGLNVAAIEEQKRLERRSKKVAALVRARPFCVWMLEFSWDRCLTGVGCTGGQRSCGDANAAA